MRVNYKMKHAKSQILKKLLYFLYSLLVINVFLLLRYERRYMFLKNYLDIDVIDFTTLLKIEEKNLLSAKKNLTV